MQADILWALLFIVIMAANGFIAARKVKNFDDYAVSGRSMHFLVLFATLACTVIGGATTMGFVSFVHKIGLNFLWVVIAISLSNIFSGFFLAGPIRKLKTKTVGELYQHYYGDKAMYIANSVAFITTVLLFGVQLTGMGNILVVLTGWDLHTCIILSTVIMLLYTWAGGMEAVSRTDLVQFVFICLGLGCTIYVGLSNAGGISGLLTTMSELKPSSLNYTGNLPNSAIVGLFLTFFLGGILSPSMVQRYASAKSISQARISVISFAIFFLLFGFVIILLGFLVNSTKLVAGHESELILLMKTLLPSWLSGLGLAAIFAAVMSTADSFLNTCSIIFVQTMRHEKVPAQRLLFIARGATFVIGILGLITALVKPEILGLVKYTFALWAPCMLPAMLPVLIKDKALFTPQAACGSMLVGLVAMIVFQALAVKSIAGMPIILVGLLLSIVTLLGVNAITCKK